MISYNHTVYGTSLLKKLLIRSETYPSSLDPKEVREKVGLSKSLLKLLQT